VPHVNNITGISVYLLRLRGWPFLNVIGGRQWLGSARFPSNSLLFKNKLFQTPEKYFYVEIIQRETRNFDFEV